MRNTSRRRDRTPCCAPAVPEGEKPVPHELKAISGQHADVRDTTPLEVDEKLPNAMVCNCSFQEALLEQDALTRPEERQSDQPILLCFCESELEWT